MLEESIFAAAIRKAPAERVAFLDGVCAANPDLRANVESLLKAHEAADGFLEPGLVALSLPTILITELCRLVSWRQVLTAVFEILSKWSAIQVLHLLCGQESRPFLRVLGRTHRPSCR